MKLGFPTRGLGSKYLCSGLPSKAGSARPPAPCPALFGLREAKCWTQSHYSQLTGLGTWPSAHTHSLSRLCPPLLWAQCCPHPPGRCLALRDLLHCPTWSVWSPMTEAWEQTGSGAITAKFSSFKSHLPGRKPGFLTQPSLPRAQAAWVAPPGRAAILAAQRTPSGLHLSSLRCCFSGDLLASGFRPEMT